MSVESEELRRLIEEVESLRSQLMEAEETLAERLAERRAFEARYLQVVAPRRARVAELTAELTRREAGATPSDGVEADVRQRERAAAEARLAADTTVDSRRAEPDGATRELYRRVARLAHPDLATSDTDRGRRESLMRRVNEAYEADDAEALRQLEVEAQAAEELGSSIGDQLVAALRQRAAISARLRAVEAELAELSHGALAELQRRVKAAGEGDRDLLTDMADELDRHAYGLQARLADLAGVN